MSLVGNAGLRRERLVSKAACWRRILGGVLEGVRKRFESAYIKLVT